MHTKSQSKDSLTTFDYISIIVISFILGMFVYSITHKDTEMCDIIFSKAEINDIERKSIKVSDSFIEYKVDGNYRVLSVDADYAIICQ